MGDEAGVRARDARSGNSRDFFFERRDLCTRLDEGEGEPPRMGEAVRRTGESWRFSDLSGNGVLAWLAFDVELPMLGVRHGEEGEEEEKGKKEGGGEGGVEDGEEEERRRLRLEGDRITGSVALISRQ